MKSTAGSLILFFFNNVFWRCYCCDSDRIMFILDQARRSIILYITCCFTFMKVTVMCVSCVLNRGEYPQRVASHFLLSEEKSVQLLLNANIELECEDRRSFFWREVDSACPHWLNADRPMLAVIVHRNYRTETSQNYLQLILFIFSSSNAAQYQITYGPVPGPRPGIGYPCCSMYLYIFYNFIF